MYIPTVNNEIAEILKTINFPEGTGSAFAVDRGSFERSKLRLRGGEGMVRPLSHIELSYIELSHSDTLYAIKKRILSIKQIDAIL